MAETLTQQALRGVRIPVIKNGLKPNSDRIEFGGSIRAFRGFPEGPGANVQVKDLKSDQLPRVRDNKYVGQEVKDS